MIKVHDSLLMFDQKFFMILRDDENGVKPAFKNRDVNPESK